MSKTMETQLDKLTQIGTEAVQSAITNYTHWFVASSLCWLAFGVVCAVSAITIWRKRDTYANDEAARLIALVLVIISVLTIPCNLPTLLNPRAYAIHQLIIDTHEH